MSFSIDTIRGMFPSLQNNFYNKPLVYLDSAATTLKPKVVLDEINLYYGANYSTVRRGVYKLAENTTAAYEKSRQRIAQFINANAVEEVIFTSGTTDSINLVAATYGRKNIKAGDEVIVSEIEHHANIVPWQMICEEKKAILKVIPVNNKGELNLDVYEKLFSPKTVIVAVGYVSNALGTIHPVKKIIDIAHSHNVPVLIDGAQSAPHLQVDVQALDCDFYAFSGHKVYGPTGCGVLYGKMKLLEEMPPYRGGGDMISVVSFEKTTYQKPPHRFEAGTPAIVEVIGLSKAIEFVTSLGLDNIERHEASLLQYATSEMLKINGLMIIGTADHKAGVISFTMKDAHPMDIGTILDREAIAIRTGHHCALPTMNRFNVPATARVSFGVYNNKDDIDKLVKGLNKVNELFS